MAAWASRLTPSPSHAGASVEATPGRGSLFQSIRARLGNFTTSGLLYFHAQRNHCHDTLGFRASTFGRGSFHLAPLSQHGDSTLGDGSFLINIGNRACLDHGGNGIACRA